MKGIISLLIAASATLFGKGAKASGASAIAPSSFCGKSVEEIGIVYYAEGGWTDNAGWTAALELLPEHGDYKINMLNLDHLTGIEYGTTLYETTMRWFDQQDGELLFDLNKLYTSLTSKICKQACTVVFS
jgi:hypothetical protein